MIKLVAEWLWRQCGATAAQYSRQREAIRPTDPPLSATRFINSKTWGAGLGGTLTMGRRTFVRSSVQRAPLFDLLDVKIATSGNSVELHVVNFESRRFHKDDGRVRTASLNERQTEPVFFCLSKDLCGVRMSYVAVMVTLHSGHTLHYCIYSVGFPSAV